MKSVARKVMIYSMVGVMQIGLGTAVVAASPLYNDGPQRIVQLDDRYHENYRQREHDEWRRHEIERHEREMRRRDRESYREWHERQEREMRYHEHERHEYERNHPGFHW